MALVISYIVGIAIFYGYTNARLKSLEDKVRNQNDIAERITRLEEKINLLLEYKIMQK
jgi:uncharacterized protein YutD